MKIRDLLAAESIELNGKVTGKKEALDAMVDLMAKSGKINNVEVYRKGVYAREEESTTGIGEGIAIPHCKSDSVSRPGLAAMVVPEGVDFDSLDGEKVNLIFLIAAPNTKENVHLDVLSKLSVLLMDEDFTANLRNAKTVDEFLHVIDAAEAEKDAEEEKKEEVKQEKKVAAPVEEIVVKSNVPTTVYSSPGSTTVVVKDRKGNTRDVDEYNRRYDSRDNDFVMENDTLYINEKEDDGLDGEWVNGEFEGSQDDYEYATRIIRFRNPRYAISISLSLIHISEPTRRS
mgnify:CR=1 FL=1